MGGYGRCGEWHFAPNPWSIPGATKGRFPYASPEPSPERPVGEAISPIRDEDKRKVAQVYCRFDPLGTGELGLQDLGTIRRILSNGSHVSEQDTALLYREMDHDRDGLVGEEDFRSYMEAWLRGIPRDERSHLLERLLHEEPCLEGSMRGSPDMEPSAIESLDAAMDALNISPGAMSEIKSYRQPPVVVEQILSLVLHMLGRRNQDWRHAKHALKSSHHFLNELREFTAGQQGWEHVP